MEFESESIPSIMKRTILLTSIIFLFIGGFSQTNNPLKKFLGTWELVPGTLSSDPMPEEIDPASVTLKVTCTLGDDGYSVLCTYQGGKTISNIPFQSSGREMLVLDPNTQMVYKLGLTHNGSEKVDYEATFVNIGKGTFDENGDLELTEYIAGNDPPAGKHIYSWKKTDEIHEYSVYYDQEGNKLTESFWVLKKK